MTARADRVAARAVRRAAAELGPLLDAFVAGCGCPAGVFGLERGGGGGLVRLAASGGALPHGAALAAVARPAPDAAPLAVPHDGGTCVVAGLPGVADSWLVVGAGAHGAAEEGAVALLRGAVAAQLRGAIEVEQAAQELGERYEEINLLYTISEILGRAVTLEETAATILTEVAETVGARRAAILVHEPGSPVLQVVAAIGTDGATCDALPVGDPASVSARVFNTLHPAIVEADEPGAPAEAPYREGAMLSVPIVWSTPAGGEPLGVVHLSARRAGGFTAGDLKLVAAIASQIAAAIQNARLVRASLQQQRLAQEMALAHDLQMRLLPDPSVVAPRARVAARVVPAESVGGDFYNLFTLDGGCTGIIVGDVSSHGYRAALIMALALSATAIHARATSDPSETLAAVLRSLHDELESTEMYISMIYVVLDPARGELRWANAGHPHAFVVDATGAASRLLADAPPLGLVEHVPATQRRPWSAADDLLVLFTDGIADALDRNGRALGEQPVLDVVRAAPRAAPADVERQVFEALRVFIGEAPPRDDLTLVVARS